MSDTYRVLHHGNKSEAARKLIAAANRRLDARDLDDYMVDSSKTLSLDALEAVRKAAWALGLSSSDYEGVLERRDVSEQVQKWIRNPGTRTRSQKKLGAERIADMRRQRKEREKAKGKRKEVVRLAQQAAANYRKNPGAYHYLAGGQANLVFLKPSPFSWRSDCSQFGAAVYKEAGLPSPASVPHMWASTSTMVKSPHARITAHPQPADLGMYGDRTGPLATRFTHHVEVCCFLPGAKYIGHGSPPIDSITPGEPDFFVTYDFLDGASMPKATAASAPEDFVPDLSGEASRAREAGERGIVERDGSRLGVVLDLQEGAAKGDDDDLVES